MKATREALKDFARTDKKSQKLVLTIFAALMACTVLRVFFMVTAMVVPLESVGADERGAGVVCAADSPVVERLAASVANGAISLSALHFGLVCLMSSSGGFVSLVRELGNDWSRFSFLEAVGHMVTAQFAGVLIYLLAVTSEMNVAAALIGSGIFGWLGNAGLERIGAWATRAFGLQLSSPAPEKDDKGA